MLSIIEHIREINPEAVLWDGLNDAVIGVDEKHRAVYSVDAIINVLEETNDWSTEDAMEWYGFNISTAYVGEYTPVLVYLKKGPPK